MHQTAVDFQPHNIDIYSALDLFYTALRGQQSSRSRGCNPSTYAPRDDALLKQSSRSRGCNPSTRTSYVRSTR